MGRTSNLRAGKLAAVPPVPRDAAKQQTREALLAAALELFVEQGLTGPSLDAICERAGYTRGAFYVHFADRDALLVAAMEKVGEAFLASVFAEAQAHARTGSEPGASSVALAAGAELHEFHGIDSGTASSRQLPLADEDADADGDADAGLMSEPEAEAESSPARSPSVLAEATARFVAAIAAGAYPLMAPPDAGSRSRSSRPLGNGPQIRPHQLIEACARSPIVRERYKALVEVSIEHVADLTAADQAAGSIRAELDPRSVGTMLLALVLGAQTMAELGVAVDPAIVARTILGTMMTPRPPRPR